jgi:hypothetical protein
MASRRSGNASSACERNRATADFMAGTVYSII